jgi:hypothetical protein
MLKLRQRPLRERSYPAFPLGSSPSQSWMAVDTTFTTSVRSRVPYLGERTSEHGVQPSFTKFNRLFICGTTSLYSMHVTANRPRPG